MENETKKIQKKTNKTAKENPYCNKAKTIKRKQERTKARKKGERKTRDKKEEETDEKDNNN